MRPNAPAVVLAVNLALVAALVYLWSDADRAHWSEPGALAPQLDNIATEPVTEPAEISRFRETLERPLFASTRRIAPRSDPQGEAKETADSLKDVRLLGTYVAGGRGGVVVVSGGKVQRVAIGDRVGEWKVAGEDGRGAAFVRANGERRKLELALNTAAPPAPSDGRTKAADAETEPAAGTDAGAASARARPAAAGGSRSRDPGARPQNPEAFNEQLRQKRLQRINERRAAKGLPPVSADR